jgi:hypothetical protein
VRRVSAADPVRGQESQLHKVRDQSKVLRDGDWREVRLSMAERGGADRAGGDGERRGVRGDSKD